MTSRLNWLFFILSVSIADGFAVDDAFEECITANPPELEWIAYDCLVRTLAYSPDGRFLASCGRYGTVVLWDAQTGKRVLTLPLPVREGTIATEATGAIFTPDGEYLATYGYECPIRWWKLPEGKETFHLDVDLGWTRDVAFTLDGALMLAGGLEGKAGIWDAVTGELKFLLPYHTADVWTVAFSPDEKRALLGGGDAVASVWDVETGERIMTLGRKAERNPQWIWSAAFSPDGEWIVTGHYDDRARWWEAKTGVLDDYFHNSPGAIDSLDFSPDGSILLTGSSGVRMEIGARFSGPPQVTLWSHTPKREIVRFPLSEPVGAAVYSPDGIHIAAASGLHSPPQSPGYIRIWDIRDYSSNPIIAKSIQLSQNCFAPPKNGASKIWEIRTSVPNWEMHNR